MGVPDPRRGGCGRLAEIDGGKMDGFLREAELRPGGCFETGSTFLRACNQEMFHPDFDFSQPPLPPLILPLHPPPGPASYPGG